MLQSDLALAKITLRELVSLRPRAVALNKVCEDDEEYRIVSALEEQAIPTLLSLLEEGAPQVKIRALALLEIITKGRNELIDPLIDFFTNAENHFIQIYITEVIASINTPEAETALINLYVEDKETRWVSLHGLLRSDNPGDNSRRIICYEARYDEDYKVRNLVRTLLRNKLWAKPFFQELVMEQTLDPSHIVRTGALKTLKECFPGHALTGKALRKALHDPNDSTRRMAACLLVGMDCHDIEDDLYQMLNNQFENVKTRAFAARIIADFTESPRKLCECIAHVIQQRAVQVAMPDNIYPSVPFVDFGRILIRFKKYYPDGIKHLENLFYGKETDNHCQGIILELIEEWEEKV